MADIYKGLVDQWNRPIEKKLLTEEIAGPTISGVRSPLTGYPGDGLNPQRLAAILREADQGDPLRYLELAETVEERDLHYAAVLGTRKRSVSQIDISVEAASDDAADVEKADLVRAWLTRDELADEVFDMLDAVGKGYSFSEIIWDTSEGQWRPRLLEWRDQRWFRPARRNLVTPTMIGEGGQEVELPGGKFITTMMRAKSGLPVRSGLSRIVAWAWMFKAFTARDWAIFTQTYGQPVRLGKYGPNATREERDVLFRAVANIAGDCAAIIPDGMSIDFVEAKNLGTGHSNYKERSDWLDQQVSKAVLGQTTTTDAISGGHAVSREHRQVQEDIERADARTLAAAINRDLIRVWMDLEYGPQKAYPRIEIARPDEEDLESLANALTPFIDRGLRVQASEIRDKFGLADPDENAEVLMGRTAAPAADEAGGGRKTPAAPPSLEKTELQHEQVRGLLPEEIIAGQALASAGPAIGAMVAELRGAVAKAGSLEKAAALLEEKLEPHAVPTELMAAMRQAMLLAWLSGEAAEADKAPSTGSG